MHNLFMLFTLLRYPPGMLALLTSERILQPKCRRMNVVGIKTPAVLAYLIEGGTTTPF